MCLPRPILHVIANLDGYGLTRQLELLAQRQISAGHQVRVIALAARREVVAKLHQSGVRCEVLDRRWQYDPLATLRLAAQLRRQPADILHFWDESSLGCFRVIRGITRGVGFLGGSKVVHPSHRSTVPGVVSPEPPTTSREQFLREQRLSADAFLIAVAGPLTRSQQIDEAIWYFELVRTLESKVRLLIFGDGPDRHRLERFARLTSEPSAIRFLGYRDDFRTLIAHADLFWQTSVADEAIPMTLIEAMSVGIATVAHDNASTRPVITNQEDGILVAENDRAAFARESLQLLQETTLAAEVGRKGACTVATKFSTQRMADGYAEIYRAAIAGDGSDHATEA